MRTILAEARGRLATFTACAIVFGLAPITAIAHPISVVVETAFVDRDRIKLDVEVFAEDLYFYHKLEANDKNEVPASALEEAAEKHGPLLLERLPIFDAKGRRVAGGKVVDVEGKEFPADIPIGELMGHDLIYRLEIPLAAPPEFLSFSQRLVDTEAGFPALVDFRAKQAGRDEEIEATLKPGDVRTVRFDWNNPELRTAGEDQGDEWLAAKREDLLGATSLNTVRSFLYITRREVRHELLIPFPLVESYLTVERENQDTLSPGEQDAAKGKIAAFFAGKNPLSIDGAERAPSSTRVEFFTLEDRDLTQSPVRRSVSAINARVGVMLVYPLQAPAESVELVWDAFNRQAWRVDAFCFVEGEILRPKFSMATRSDTFRWERSEAVAPTIAEVATAPTPTLWSIPWLALLLGGVGLAAGFRTRRRPALAGAILAVSMTAAASVWPSVRMSFLSPLYSPPVVTDDEAAKIFAVLHGNLYRSIEAATDEEALDYLSASADGELLRDLYLRLVKSFHSPDDSGALPSASNIAILEQRKFEGDGQEGFGYFCRWDVTGRVEHWGHVHSRRYQYEANFQIAPRDGSWKIVSLDLRDAKIVEDESVGLL